MMDRENYNNLSKLSPIEDKFIPMIKPHSTESQASFPKTTVLHGWVTGGTVWTL